MVLCTAQQPGALLIAMCTAENLTDYKLNPPQTMSRVQYALVSISGQTSSNSGESAYVVQQVQLVAYTEVEQIAFAMRQLLTVERTAW